MFQPDAVMEAFEIVLVFETLLWLAIGVLLGGAVGAIPGLTASTGIALMIPIAVTLNVGPALGLIIGLYKGAIYGGSISAISFGVPGTSGAAATVLDGYKLAKMGKTRKALEMALYASVTGDTLSDVFTIFVAPMVVLVAFAFGPTERLWLVLLGIVLIGALSGKRVSLGLISASIGVFIGSIGVDPVTNLKRMTFGLWWLRDGVDLIPLVIGIFALPVIMLEIIPLLQKKWGKIKEEEGEVPKKIRLIVGEALSIREYLLSWKEMFIGTGVGTFLGMLPGLGATPAAFLSLGIAQQASPWKEIGTGKLEGVAAAEAGNNATCGPTLIPLLAFGIPGSPVAALIGGTLMFYGATPGPRIFEYYPEVVYALFMLLLVANIFNLGIGLLIARVYAMLANFPKQSLIPLIFVLSIIGSYSARGNIYDVYLMLLLGLLGFGMLLCNIPTAPLVIAFILAPMLEINLRRALMMNPDDLAQALFGSPLAIGLIFSVVILVAIITRYFKKIA